MYVRQVQVMHYMYTLYLIECEIVGTLVVKDISVTGRP